MLRPFLSRDDIAVMTRTPFRKRQVEFLVRNGIRHYVDGHGWPVVAWAALDGQAKPETQTPPWKPNKAA